MIPVPKASKSCQNVDNWKVRESEVKAKPATMKYGRRAGDIKRAQGQNSVSSSNRHNKKPVTVMGTGTAYFEQA